MNNNKFKKLFRELKERLKNPEWFSAYIQLLLLIVTVFSIFFTNIKEYFIVNNLNEKKIILEKELIELKKLSKEYVLSLGNVITDNIIQDIENEYKNYYLLNEKLSKMQELEKNIIDECKDGSLNDWFSTFDSWQDVRDYYAIYFLPEFLDEFKNYDYLIFCRDENEKEFIIDNFERQRDLFIKKNNKYGYEILNSLSVKFLPNTDKIKLENFLNEYSNNSSYNKPIYQNLSKWDYNEIKESTTIVEKNIKDLQNDLPNLKNKLRDFFNNL